MDLNFVNRNTGYGVAWHHNYNIYGSTIYKTTNGGQNWTFTPYPDTLVFILSLYFIDANTGFFGTASSSVGNLYKTTNGSQSWIQCSVDSSMTSRFPVRNIRFLDALTGIAAGGFIDIAGVAWRTTDGGNNWSSSIVGAEPLNSIMVKNSNELIVCGGDYEYGVSMCTTSNAGLNWAYNTLNVFGLGTSIAMRTQSEYWISSGFSQKFIYTTNSGVRWVDISTPDSTLVSWLCFPNQNTGWACGDNGKILKFTPSNTFVHGNEVKFEKSFRLNQNYPNPFNPSTNISFDLIKNGKISLIIYDVLGREVKRIINDELYKVGNYDVSFDASGLPSGIYIYTLISDLNKDSKRMVLTK